MKNPSFWQKKQLLSKCTAQK